MGSDRARKRLLRSKLRTLKRYLRYRRHLDRIRRKSLKLLGRNRVKFSRQRRNAEKKRLRLAKRETARLNRTLRRRLKR